MQTPQKGLTTSKRQITKSGVTKILNNWYDRFMTFNSHAVEGVFDRLQGLNTRGAVALEKLGLANEERLLYVPSGWLTLSRVARVIKFSEQDVFVDFGAGKGRVVVMAARHYPFKKVIGVEIAPELSLIAQDNVDRNYRKLKCKKVEVITSDALQYEIPSDITIAFLFTPFTGSIFKDVITRIGSTLQSRNDKRLWVVLQRPYKSPHVERYNTNNEVLQNCTWLKQVEEIVTRTTFINVYKAIEV